MNYKLTKLPNSAKLITIPLPSLASVTLAVWVRVGSRYESDAKAGLSHFLEHMAFKGSKRYPTSQIVSKTIDAMGAESNAGTAHEWTNFYIKTRSSNLEKAFDIISDLLSEPKFAEAEIEKERQVILEEIAMYEDTPYEKVGELFMQLVFAGNSMARDVAGTPKTVKALRRSDFVNYKDNYYHATNMVITVAGGVTNDKVVKLARKYFTDFPKGKLTKPAAFKSQQNRPQLKLEYKKSEQAHVILGFVGYSRYHKDRYAASLLATILGSGRSSRLFDEVREKRGLAYAVSTSMSRYTDTGFFATYAGVSPARAEEAIKVILDEHRALAEKTKKLDKDELVKAKEYVKGRMALSLEDTSAVDSFFGSQVMFDRQIIKPEEVFRRIDAVNVEQIYKVAKDIFVTDKMSLAIIGPYKSQSGFEKLMR